MNFGRWPKPSTLQNVRMACWHSFNINCISMPWKSTTIKKRWFLLDDDKPLLKKMVDKATYKTSRTVQKLGCTTILSQWWLVVWGPVVWDSKGTSKVIIPFIRGSWESKPPTLNHQLAITLSPIITIIMEVKDGFSPIGSLPFKYSHFPLPWLWGGRVVEICSFKKNFQTWPSGQTQKSQSLSIRFVGDSSAKRFQKIDCRKIDPGTVSTKKKVLAFKSSMPKMIGLCK